MASRNSQDILSLCSAVSPDGEWCWVAPNSDSDDRVELDWTLNTVWSTSCCQTCSSSISLIPPVYR